MPWFETERIDAGTFRISEPKHVEETNCWLLEGEDRALLFDSGLGAEDIGGAVKSLSSKPVTAVPSHVHWDHIGGLGCFRDFYVHALERDWIEKSFPISRDKVLRELRKGELPERFSESGYKLFRGSPDRVLRDGERIELGGRSLEVIHTPGHSPGHICLWEAEKGWLFTGDIVYKGMIYADYPSTDPSALLRSIERLAALPVRKIFPGHHSVDVKVDIIQDMINKLRELEAGGRLRHGGGTFHFGDWGIRL